eukprot:scaffold1.g5378.t1
MCVAGVVGNPPGRRFLVPRQSYLHSVVAEALRLLRHLLPPGELSPWFEHERLPLKWSVPAGVLYDLLAREAGGAPWRLTLHFRGYPVAQLPPYDGPPALRAAFFNALKEAAFVVRGSAARVMEMSGGAQADLWAAALAGALGPYAQIVQALQLSPVARRGRPPCVPLRLFVRRGGRGAYLTSYEDISYTSRPAEAQAADGSLVSLRQALLPLVAECLRAGWGRGAGAVASEGGLASPTKQQELQEQQQQQQQAEQQEEPESKPSTAAAAPRSASDAEAGDADGSDAGAGEPSSAEKAPRSSEVTQEPLPPEPSGAVLQQAGPQKDAADGTAVEEALEEVVVAGIRPPLDMPLEWLHTQLHAADYFLYVVVQLKE